MSRRPYIEHCPTCTVVVVVPPYAVIEAGADAVIAYYHCHRCTHSWTTNWQRQHEITEIPI